jgi:ADP-ribosylglycohydrolase
LFEHLGEALGFRHEADDFRRLTGFSFVTPATHAAPTPAPPATDSESLSGVYEVHRVLRQSVADVEPTAVRSAHQILVDYFQARAEHLLSRVESIYHRNQVDPADGVRAWLGAIQSALALGRFDFCRTYLALLPDLDVESDEELHACIYISARAAIGLGRWADAEDLLDDLPEGSAHALLLRADLAFLRGQFAPANALTKRALDGAPTGLPRLPFLFRVAELHLFLGYHDEARALCREAVMLAGGAEDRVLAANGQARFLNLAGEVAYFAGELDEARDTFRRAHEAIAAIAEEDRDQALQATLRQNDALVALTDGAWDAAALAQADALAIRRRIADARGIAHSLHGLGVAIAGSGDYPAAEASFSQAAEAATALGDDLLLGKINRARGEAALVAGKLDVARTALDQALAQLQRVGIDYDVAHAQLTMARLQHRLGREMTRVALWDDARRVIEPRKYLSLYTLFPEARVPSAERLYHGLLGLATGDALGVPWEGRPPAEIDEAEVARVPTRPGWPPGITSDDTTVVRVMSRHLIATNGRGDASGFLRALAAARTELRGIGETTRAALDRFVQTGRAERASDGATNGALVRALPVGWTYPRFATADRRELVELLTTTTHGDPVAIAAAQVIAVMASVAVEGVSLATVCSAAVDELTEQAHAHAEVAGALDAVRVWTPGPGGVEMTAAGTLGAVLHLLDHFPDEVALADAQLAAVSLGGDTDSVAAVVGGIVACRTADAGGQLPWIDRMALGDLEELHEIAEGLHALRQAAYREAPNE